MSQKVRNTIIITLIIILIAAIIFLLIKFSYKKQVFNELGECSYKKCECLGLIIEEVGLKTDYICKGLELCKSTNEVCS